VAAIALAMLAGLGAGLFRPASQALLPTLAPDLLTEANALQSLTSRVGLIVGPGLGGLFLVLGGTSAAFWFDGATFLASVISLAGITDAKPGRSQEDGIIAEARAGIRAVLDRPWVATIIGQGTVQLLFAMAPALVLLPIYLRAHGHMPAYGLLLSLQAAGSAAGGLLVGLRPPRKPGTVGVLGLGLLGFQLLCMATGAPLPLLDAAMFLTGLGYALFGVLWASALQRSIPGELLGRVFAVEMLGTYALEPVGLAIAPLIAVAFGLRDVLITAMVVMVLTTVIPLLVPGVREFSDPVARGAERTEPVNQS
ncbi:MAG: MFS transporter, partial [Actinomycetota bacterium]|nr:MFS transporter [Actinomycetota bacterium]